MPRYLLALCTATMLAACNPYTYVNVPPQQGDLALHDPNQALVRHVEVETLTTLLARRPVAGPAAIVLPRGTDELTVADVARRVGEPAVAGHEAPDDAQRVEVTQLRIRGTRAQVDVLYPTLTGTPQLLTAYLSYTPINGWRVDRIADWPGATHPVDHGGLIEP